MTVCDAGDVAIVPFPFTGIAVAKPRPALALSAREANEANGATLFTMITTAQRSCWPSDIPLSDGEAAALSDASLVRLKLFTLDNRRVSRVIGSLSSRDRRGRAQDFEISADDLAGTNSPRCRRTRANPCRCPAHPSREVSSHCYAPWGNIGASRNFGRLVS